MWKWVAAVFLIAIAGCAGGAWWLVSSEHWTKIREMAQPGMKATPVRLEQVGRGDIIRSVSAPGLTEPRTKVAISAQVSAQIMALPFRENQLVKKDDVVVRLDSRDLVANLESARAQLKSEEARLDGAKAAFVNAERELARRRELYSSKDIAQTSLEAAETEYERTQSSHRQAQFAIEIAKANISRAEKDLDNAIIRAPFDGVIVRLNAEVGEIVVVGTLNNAGSVIMEVADLSVMVIKAKVDESNVGLVRAGQNAVVTLNAFPDEKFTAVVERVDLQRQLDRDGTAYFETDLLLSIPANRELQWGLQANSDIAVETIRDAVRVPSQAILDRPIDELPARVTTGNALVDRTKKFARVTYMVENGKAVTVPVTIGPSDLTHTVILAGIEVGQTVVTGPFKSLTALKDGQSVVDELSVKDKNLPAPAATAGATGGTAPR